MEKEKTEQGFKIMSYTIYLFLLQHAQYSGEPFIVFYGELLYLQISASNEIVVLKTKVSRYRWRILRYF